MDYAFDRHVIDPAVSRHVDRFALQEGLVSALWQTWCRFCRQTLILSVQGAHTAAGALTTSTYSARTEMEIAYIAVQLAQRNNVGRVKSLSGSHQEPTWGDAKKLNLISIGFNSSNSSTLTAAFSSCTTIEDLQLCRNAGAHISADMVQQIRSARVKYNDTKFSHPSDMIVWVDASSNDFLWKSWIDEMLLISTLAIQ